MKKNQKFLITVFTLASLHAFADESVAIRPILGGLDLENTNASPAYNLPAAINTHKWDYFVEGSFIYWHVSEEFLSPGTEIKIGDVYNDGERYTNSSYDENITLTPSFAYSPGFKLDFGVNTPFDNWSFDFEWTRIKEEIKTQYKLKEGTSFLNLWEPMSNTAYKEGYYVYPLELSTEWAFHLNIFDLNLSRPFYEGKRLIISPMIGLRGLTLKQNTRCSSKSNYQNDELGVGPFADITLNIDYPSHIWSIGPRLGADLDWLLYKELRIITSGAGSLLYTRYTLNKTIPHYYPKKPINFLTAFDPYDSTTNPQFSALRANLELDLGLGWGTYFSNQKYHIDFRATYDFQAFFKMNVMSAISPAWIGDIYIHGLTVSGRFDF